jgi:hypothetical protein
VSFEAFGKPSETALTCRLIGNPGPLQGCRFGPDDCRKVRFSADSLGVGLGALGSDYADCQGRFGEFLAVAGAAAYLPTDGTNVPDYLVAAGDSVPEMEVCYGIQCEGPLDCFARFEAEAETGRVPLSALVEGCLDLAGADRIGLVLLGETSGLMGAALRRSPTRDAPLLLTKASNRLSAKALQRSASGAVAGSPFEFPQVRDWLSFTAERAYVHSMALVVGVAGRGGERGSLAPLVRPLRKEPAPWVHLHAATFSYQPLPRGEIDMRSAVTTLFEQQTLQGILHLLADHRDRIGLGESQFVRGVCWFAPMGDVAEDKS